MADFEVEIGGLMDREGAFVDDPDDPGGATKWGISARSYPDEDIPNMTRLRASEIYWRDFWHPLKCDEIHPQAVASLLFDAGVMSGAKQAIKTLQAASGARTDGIIGPMTLYSVNHAKSFKLLAAEFALRRIQFYVSLTIKRSSRKKFFLGWVNRTLTVYFNNRRLNDG